MAIIFPEGTQNYPSIATRYWQTDRSDRATLSGRTTEIMSITLTPRSTSSRFLITAHVHLNINGTTVGMKLTVNNANIDPLVGDQIGSNRLRMSSIQGSSHGSWVVSQGLSAIYHPNSTSSQVIRCHVGSHVGSTFYLNYAGNATSDVGNIDESTASSVLTVIEFES